MARNSRCERTCSRCHVDLFRSERKSCVVVKVCLINRVLIIVLTEDWTKNSHSTPDFSSIFAIFVLVQMSESKNIDCCLLDVSPSSRRHAEWRSFIWMLHSLLNSTQPERFCVEILSEIHDHVQTMTLEPISIERILSNCTKCTYLNMKQSEVFEFSAFTRNDHSQNTCCTLYILTKTGCSCEYIWWLSLSILDGRLKSFSSLTCECVIHWNITYIY